MVSPVVRKASGELEAFDESKVRKSLFRLKIPSGLQEEVILHVKNNLLPEISTRDIYREILNFLKDRNIPQAGKFNLKQALMELGPTGYPFEKYIAAVLDKDGYSTQVQQHIMGKCVTHEIDVVAEKQGQKVMIECKFHNQWGIRSDIKVTLYVKARYDDIQSKHNFTQAWVITNTKCTSDALIYAQCAGLHVVSWNHGLPELIEKTQCFPVTCLTTLSLEQKAVLINHNVILLTDILSLTSTNFRSMGIAGETIVKGEAKSILGFES